MRPLVQWCLVVCGLTSCGLAAYLLGFSESDYHDKPPQRAAASSVLAAAKDAVTPCQKEVSDAVLNKLYPVLGNSPYKPTERWFDEEDAKIACVRDWVKSLKDTCQHDAYNDWLNFYANQSKEHRDDLRKNKEASNAAKYDAEEREKAQRLRSYESQHPVPPPPKCDLELIRSVK